MKSPIIKFFPKRVQRSLLYRCYFPVKEKWHHLFETAELSMAPNVKMKLVPSDLMHASIAFTGEYETELSREVVRLSRSTGGLLIDVGANAGYFSLLWVASNSNSTAIAFEPSPRNTQIIKENIRNNGFDNRITLRSIALGRDTGEFDFDLGPSESTGWGGLVHETGERTIRVQVERLDELIPSDAVIDLLKIDTEGADTWVLQGCEKLLLEKRINEIHFEQNKPRLAELGISEFEAEDYLRSTGYIANPLSNTTKQLVDWKATPDGLSKIKRV